ncbi:MAG: alpha/beta hydrolase [Myxococcota bacterium]
MSDKQRRKQWFGVGLVGAALLLASVLLLMFFETSFIYFPSPDVFDSPADYGLLYEDVHTEASDGVELHGWLMKPVGEPRAWLLFSHGNAGNVSGRPEIARPLVERGMAVLLYDYRGYGRSKGNPDEAGTYRDAEAMLSVLLDRASSPKRVFLFGRSLGGGVSYEIAVRHPELGGLITDATFTSMPDMARKVFPIPGAWLLVRTKYDNLKKAPNVRMPRLVMHGTRDELIPFTMGQALRDATDPPAAFFPIEGGGHNDTFVVGGREYAEVVRRFVDTCLDGAASD